MSEREDEQQRLSGQNAASLALNARERQIVSMAADGHTDKQIGAALGISRDTVATYWRRLFAKMGVSSRAEAIARLSALALSEQRSLFKEADRTRRLLACISDPTLYGITNRNQAVLALELLLSRVLNLVECEFGYIGEVVSDGNSFFLSTCAVSLRNWTEDARHFYEAHRDSRLEFSNPDTWFGRVITGRDVVLNNQSSGHSTAGLPVGHMPIDQFLGLPLFDGDNLIGVLGLANREGGFDRQSADFLQPILNACASIIIGVRAQIRQETKLAASENRMQTLLDEMSEGVIFVDREHRIRVANSAFCELFNLRTNGALSIGGRCASAAGAISRRFKNPQAFLDKLRSRSRAAEPFEELVDLQDGRTVAQRFQPLYSGGQLDGYLWIYKLAS